MPEDKRIAKMLFEEYISWENFLHNNCLSLGLWKWGESHMTYLARNTVKTGFRHTPQNDWALEKYLKYSCVIVYLTAWAKKSATRIPDVTSPANCSHLPPEVRK